MENFDLIALLIEWGPVILAALVGILIPANKVPLIKNFVKKTDEELNKEKEAEK